MTDISINTYNLTLKPVHAQTRMPLDTLFASLNALAQCSAQRDFFSKIGCYWAYSSVTTTELSEIFYELQRFKAETNKLAHVVPAETNAPDTSLNKAQQIDIINDIAQKLAKLILADNETSPEARNIRADVLAYFSKEQSEVPVQSINASSLDNLPRLNNAEPHISPADCAHTPHAAKYECPLSTDRRDQCRQSYSNTLNDTGRLQDINAIYASTALH